MTAKKLELIARKAAGHLASLVRNGEGKIMEACESAAAEAIENDETPKFKLGFVVTLDLKKEEMECALTWGVKHRLSVVGKTPDPMQPGLPGIKEDAEPAAGTVLHAKFKKALREDAQSSN